MKRPDRRSRGSRVEGRGLRAGDGPGVGELVDTRRGLVDRHVDGLDEGAVGESQAELDAAVHGLLAARDFGKADRSSRASVSRRSPGSSRIAA